MGAASTNSGQGPYSATQGSAPAVPSAGLARFSGSDSVFDVATGEILYGYGIEGSDLDDEVLYKVSKNFCTRYEVKFNGRSGDLPDLDVDTSGILVPSSVNEVDNVG